MQYSMSRQALDEIYAAVIHEAQNLLFFFVFLVYSRRLTSLDVIKYIRNKRNFDFEINENERQ